MKALWVSVPLWLGSLSCGSNQDVAGYLQGATSASSVDPTRTNNDGGGVGAANSGVDMGGAGGAAANDPAGDDGTDGIAPDGDGSDTEMDTASSSDPSSSIDPGSGDSAGDDTSANGFGSETAPEFVPGVPLEPAEPAASVEPEVPDLAPSTSSTMPFEGAFPDDAGSESWPPEDFPGGPLPGELVLWVSGWPLEPPPVGGAFWPLPFSLDQFFGEPALEPGYQRGMWVRGYDGDVLAHWWYDVTHDPTLPPGVLVDIEGQRFVVTVDLSGDAYMVSADLPPEGTQPLLPIPEGF